MKKFKILFVKGEKKHETSGIGKYSTEIIKILKKRNIIEVQHLPSSNFLIKYFYKFILLPIYLILFTKRFDKIIIYEEGFAFLGLFLKKSKSSIIIHDIRFDYSGKITLKEKFKNIYLRLNFLFIDKFKNIIVPSKFTKKLILNYYNFIDKNKIIIQNNIISRKSINNFNSNNFLKNYGINKNSKTILLMNISNAESRKNFIYLAKIINQIDENIKFIKIGPTTNNHLITNKKKIFGFNNISEYNLIKLFKISSVYVDFSEFEGFGRTTIEAQSYGLPVLCLKTDTNFETMGKSAIYLNNKNNYEEFIIKLNFLIKNRKKYKKLSLKNSKVFLPKNQSYYVNNLLKIL